jgi:hypothetical protein
MANLQERSEESVSALAFETTPWVAADRTVEEPRRAPEAALRLSDEDHVVDLQETESIRAQR